MRNETDIHVVGQAENGQEALDICKQREIDVVLMDLMMPIMNGVEAARLIRENCPKTRILAVTINEESRFIKEILAAGANGYILKHSTKDEIVRAIREVAIGRQHYGKGVMERISDEFANVTHGSKPILTKKESQVLELIAQECTNQEIADKLNCGIRTVDTHKRNLLRKLEVKNVVGLVKYAIKMGIVQE
jgi:DNA-binding NarL/FixJ family response regulator